MSRQFFETRHILSPHLRLRRNPSAESLWLSVASLFFQSCGAAQPRRQTPIDKLPVRQALPHWCGGKAAALKSR